MTTTTMDRNDGLDLLNLAIVKVEETIKKAGGTFKVMLEGPWESNRIYSRSKIQVSNSL